VHWSSCKVPVNLVIFERNLDFLQGLLNNTQVSRSVNIHAAGAELLYGRTDGRTDGHTHTEDRTDMIKLIVAFRNFAKAPKDCAE
jgi:hypothetical protein